MLLLQQPQDQPTTGEIQGRLVFSDGLPAARMLVTAIEAGLPSGRRPLFGASDGSGAYRLTNLPGGRYYLQVSIAGKPVFYPGVDTPDAAVVVTVPPGSSVANPDFVLPETGVRVSGRVIVPSGQTPANPLVQMGQAAAPIDADGRFEFPHVFPGSYSLNVPSPGAQPVRISVANQDVTGIVLNVPRVVPVSGTVNADGGARPLLSLQFEGPTYRTSVGVRPDGTFATQLPVGGYLTTAFAGPPPAGRVQTPPPFPSGYYVKQLETESQNLLTGPLRIGDADSRVRIAMSLGVSPGVTVSGRVNVADTKADRSRNVSLTSFVTSEIAEAAIQDDGSFEISRIPPGTYMASVSVTPQVRSAPVTVVVPNRGLTGLEIAVPQPQEVIGRVAVDGNGQPPKFSLTLIREGEALTALDRNGVQSAVDAAVLARSGGAQVISVRVDTLPDGTFRTMLPQGDYRVIAEVGLTSYFIRSLTHGSSRLLTEPLRVTDRESAEIHVGFGLNQPNPWRKIRGRVTGIDPVKGPFRVALEGNNNTATVETPIDSDGAFEFPAALVNQRYRLRVIPHNDAASSPPVTVEDKDLEGVQIVVPREREVELHASVEGNGPVPQFMVSLSATANVAGREVQTSSVSKLIEPGVDGAFKALLPVDERRLRISGLPLGYIVKSLRFGTADLLKDNLNLSRQAGTHIEVQFAIDPAASFVSIEGRVTGLDTERGGVRLVLNGAAAHSTFETTVDSSGFFRFLKIPQGPYVPSLTGGVTSGPLTPSSIVAERTDLTGVELKFSKSNAVLPSSGNALAPTGTTVTDLTGINPSSREAANESAAIANLRTLNTALVTFLSASGGKYGSLADLIAAGLIDSTMAGVKAGYHFSIVAVGREYAAAAIPATPNSGRFGFYSSADAVIRYSPVSILAPARMGGNVVQ
jgi:hypothetical protein